MYFGNRSLLVPDTLYSPSSHTYILPPKKPSARLSPRAWVGMCERACLCNTNDFRTRTKQFNAKNVHRSPHTTIMPSFRSINAPTLSQHKAPTNSDVTNHKLRSLCVFCVCSLASGLHVPEARSVTTIGKQCSRAAATLDSISIAHVGGSCTIRGQGCRSVNGVWENSRACERSSRDATRICAYAAATASVKLLEQSAARSATSSDRPVRRATRSCFSLSPATKASSSRARRSRCRVTFVVFRISCTRVRVFSHIREFHADNVRQVQIEQFAYGIRQSVLFVSGITL